MKTRLLSLLVLLALVFALAACGGTEEAEPTEAPAAEPTEEAMEEPTEEPM